MKEDILSHSLQYEKKLKTIRIGKQKKPRRGKKNKEKNLQQRKEKQPKESIKPKNKQTKTTTRETHPLKGFIPKNKNKSFFFYHHFVVI